MTNDLIDGLTFGDLAPGQYAFYVDKGFDHGSFRTYFVQRHPEANQITSPDGRVLTSILSYEVIHFSKTTSRKDEQYKENILLAYGATPIEHKVDSRYGVEA